MAVTYKVIKECGSLGRAKDRSNEIRVRIISWNDDDPKVDIRPWTDDGEARKGVTLNRNQLEALKEIIKDVTL